MHLEIGLVVLSIHENLIAAAKSIFQPGPLRQHDRRDRDRQVQPHHHDQQPAEFAIVCGNHDPAGRRVAHFAGNHEALIQPFGQELRQG